MENHLGISDIQIENKTKWSVVMYLTWIWISNWIKCMLPTGDIKGYTVKLWCKRYTEIAGRGSVWNTCLQPPNWHGVFLSTNSNAKSWILTLSLTKKLRLTLKLTLKTRLIPTRKKENMNDNMTPRQFDRWKRVLPQNWISSITREDLNVFFIWCCMKLHVYNEIISSIHACWTRECLQEIAAKFTG